MNDKICGRRKSPIILDFGRFFLAEGWGLPEGAGDSADLASNGGGCECHDV
jgi:hypothetical protein